MDKERRVLHSPFNIETHKETFVNYLEVVILEDGTVEYAVPSHQRKLIALACQKLNATEDELAKQCPEEYYFDFMKWLCMVSGAVALWNNFMEGTPNDQQKKSVEQLIEAKLYWGDINAVHVF